MPAVTPAAKRPSSTEPGVRLQSRSLRRGSTMVEFALGFTVFLLLVLGMLDLGRGVWAWNTLVYATREGARYAIVHGASSDSPATASDIEEQVRSFAVGLDSSQLTITTTWQPTNSPGDRVLVQSNYSFQLVAAALFGDQASLPMRSRARMIITH